ncbi:UNVERIFIED_CONTAM: hypothetical protein Sindi_0719400 [Sesamum indicum]
MNEDDKPDVTEVWDDLKMGKDASFAIETTVITVPQILGFSANNAAEEDEAILEDLAMADERELVPRSGDDIPMSQNSNFVEDERDPMCRQNLGFREAPLNTSHGGREGKEFPMAEFLRLATAVVDDGDEKSKEALLDLKRRWDARLGGETSRRHFPTDLNPNDEPPLIRGLRKAIRNIQSPETRKRTTESGCQSLKTLSANNLAKNAAAGIFPADFSRPATVADVENNDLVTVVNAEVEGSDSLVISDVVHDKAGDVALMKHISYADISNTLHADVSMMSSATAADLSRNTSDDMAPDCTPKVGTGHGYEKIKAYTSTCMDQIKAPLMEFWTTEGLSTVASGVGKPLYPDAITRACTRLDFARVCVMIDGTQKLAEHIIIMTPNENGGETLCKIDVEYEWLPLKCTTCMTLGHMDKECTLNKPHKQMKPPVAVYVPKPIVPQPPLIDKERKIPNPECEAVEVQNSDAGYMHAKRKTSKQDDRGKTIVIYNTFDALSYIDEADKSTGGPSICSPVSRRPMLNIAMWNVRRLNKRDHQLAVKDLVSEYRLHFLGILETRVRLNNIMHIQSFLLPQWKWYVDYNSVGNRIWLVWDENFVDVHILDMGEQFVHCRVTSRTVNEPFFITVVYGASEVVDRRALWTALGTLAQQCSDIPWLVGGDFNAVRGMNEMCGISGDIRVAMEEFNVGIQEAGLIPLPMQGRYPTSSYHSLPPWTSDHSPLVLNGDVQQHNGAKGFLEEAQLLLSSDRQNEFYLCLEHCCRIVYAKAAKLEQSMLQQRAKMQWMKDGDQCSRVFFRKIAQRRVMRRILQINDGNGTTHTDQGEIIHEFVSYYQTLLGEDKAPGPDGYSSGFFKAAWPVVGKEVTRAVLDFFSAEKLLKQITSTILALIPKVHTPMSVNDFRPISCSNVLYKIIVKLLVQRISILVDKIISPCQTTFIPGRSIGDNIMLAQELFSGYNQMRLPPRCALKVDIRKAYDTMEWDFLIAVLQLFGFPPMFTRWIEECVCTTSFSIGLIGKPHGFFTGARGL